MSKNPKPSAKRKVQPEKLLVKVPEENIFWCYNRRIFSDLTELA